MVQSLLIPSSFYTMLLLALLLSNRVHGFGGVSMNPLLSSRMMVTRGHSLTRTHSERNDKAFLPWNMARTPTTKHARANDAEGSRPDSGKYEFMEMMRSMLKSQKDMAENMATKEQVQGLNEQVQGLKEQVQGLATKEQVQGLATKEQVQGLKKQVQGLKKQVQGLDKRVSALQEENAQVLAMMQGMEKRLGKTATKEQVQDLENTLLDLEDTIGILVEIEARAKARRKFADHFS
jgi:polyhydroxyalkanoate synthesis regulator phasin